MPSAAPRPPLSLRKAAPPDENAARGRGIQRVAIVALAINAALTVGQIVIGLFAGAFSLVADAAHTLSDLVTDVLVLVAGRHSSSPADLQHPYGHARVETVTSLLLGLVLGGVGFGFLWSSGVRLQHMDQLPALHPAALAMAVLTLAAKEGMFRYILASARRLQAPILETNAWHARSDAASSLVVAAGIGGSLAGYPFLEPLAAAIVGFLIVHMGFRFALKAVRELIDTGLSEEELARLRRTILDTPGVVNLHDMRTRRMANRVLCDAHVQVEPRLTVSEGHRVSDSVYARVRTAHPEVQDILVHIDPEDDANLQGTPPGVPPGRAEVLATVADLLGPPGPKPKRVQIHYLGDRIDVEVLLPASVPDERLHALNRRIEEWLGTHPAYRSMSFFVQIAP
ncbi:cation diffusion facilitator family transporter [Thauera sinica]|uniref:Cation diffusion facilitator family transporter n=1 Tax=Thauera sinica TaxID=2665146 RepID=A0ABW1AUM7_9RHOO|nr:cation diffusion facilitator family transporter [Thauera sp. K11]ATE58577.1 cation-efflux pump [Thauera sp. K11]